MSADTLINSLNEIQPDNDGHLDAIALHAMDTMAVLLAGLDAAEGKAIARFYGHASEAEQIAGMAAIIRYTECDDIHIPSCVSPGCIAIPTALAFAKNSQSAANAIEAGYGIGLAFANAIGGVKALDHGVWPTLFAAPAIAAVTSAIAQELDNEMVTQALVLAMSGASGRTGCPGGFPSGRWLAIGEATLKGLRASEAARLGFCGDKNLFSEQWLISQTASDLADPKMLQSVAQAAVSQIGLKPFVAARQGANAIKAFVDLLDTGLQPNDIDSIEVYLPEAAIPVVTRELDLDSRLSTIANLGLQFGIAAFERPRLLDIGREQPFKAQTINLAKNVKIIVESCSKIAGADGWPARVKVCSSSESIEQICTILPGDPRDESPMEVVKTKIKHFSQSALFDEFFIHQMCGLEALNRANKNLYVAASQRFAEQCCQSGKPRLAS